MSTSAQTAGKLARRRRWGLWLGVCLLNSILVSAGCTPGSLGYLFLLQNPNEPPEWFNFTKEKSTPKVVFLVCHGSAKIQSNTDLYNTDQLLAQKLNQVLAKLYKANGDKVDLVSPFKVQDFKAKHFDWKVMGLDEVGKNFKADYVVNLEITKLSMYESRQLYRGKAEIQLSVIDVKSEEAIVQNKSYVCTYPDHGPVPSDDFSPEVFRDQFLSKIANDLSRWFAPYPFEDRHDMGSGSFGQ